MPTAQADAARQRLPDRERLPQGDRRRRMAVKINGGTFDGVGAIAAVKVPTSLDVMQPTVFPQTRLPRLSGSRAFVILCWVRETS